MMKQVKIVRRRRRNRQRTIEYERVDEIYRVELACGHFKEMPRTERVLKQKSTSCPRCEYLARGGTEPSPHMNQLMRDMLTIEPFLKGGWK